MNFRASQVYIIMMFMTALAISTMSTTYGVYLIAELGLTPFQLVMMGTVMEGSALIFEGVTGVVADTYSRRLSVIIGMFVLGAGFVLEGSVQWIGSLTPFISVFMWILVAEFVSGFGWTFISGADMAWIVDEVGEENVGHLFMRAKRVSLIATLLGILLSVGLSTVAPNLPFVAAGLSYLGLGAFLMFFMKETKFVHPERSAQSSHWHEMKTTWVTGAKVVRRHSVLLMIVAVTLFSGAASEGYDRLWEAHLITGIGFPQGVLSSMAIWFGLISVLTTLTGMLAIRITEKRLDMSNEHSVFYGMFVLTAAHIAAILSFAFSPSFAWALGSLLALGVIRTLKEPIYNTWLNMNIENKSRATVLSMISQSDALGQAAGGPLVGWVGSRISVRASLVVAAVLLSPIMAVFARVLRKK
ncbi:MFS transporter [Paenibacillus apiarius]|uniref:MFS transporter n=1 Tax=Paenibacillus apiarius TaxID=46240 RepID=UPI003B3B6C3C